MARNKQPTDEERKQMKKAQEAIAAIRAKMDSDEELRELRKEAWKQYVAEEAEKSKQQIPVPIIQEKQREPRTLKDFLRKRGWKI